MPDPQPLQALVDVTSSRCTSRAWVDESVRRIMADANRSADTHLIAVPWPEGWRRAGIDLYLKDESTHPTGSLKHRLARSLFLYAICNGQIGPETTVIEASSGSTAVSEAYFARMLGLPFVAVMARSTSGRKVTLIEREGGRCHLVDDPAEVYDVARRLADECDGHYLDQFTYAERATDWRGNNNIAESVFEQLAHERHPVPTWVVVGAGTGGTSATIGRYVRYRGLATRVAVVDPEGSAFLPGYDNRSTAGSRGSLIEGIGRPRVEPSFVPTVVDRMLGVPDAASVAAMRFLRQETGIRAGGSTGTNLYGALRLACEMRAVGETGSVVTLMCDQAERYEGTYGDDAWLAAHGLELDAYLAVLDRAWTQGEWTG
jgi:cysteine synthase A